MNDFIRDIVRHRRKVLDEAVKKSSPTDSVIASFISKAINEADSSHAAVQNVTITVPALIRLCEIAREDIKGDTELHQFIELLLANGAKIIDSDIIDKIELKEEVVAADRKMGKDGKLHAPKIIDLTPKTNTLTGAKISGVKSVTRVNARNK